LPSVENLPRTKEKKIPHYTKQVKKCRDVDPEVLWKLVGINIGLVSK